MLCIWPLPNDLFLLISDDELKSERTGTQSSQNRTINDGGIDNKHAEDEDEDVVLSSLQKTLKQSEKDMAETRESPELPPHKRVTRSSTGTLKPKQQFDEIQEKEELKNAKRKDVTPKRGKKKKADDDDGQSEDESSKRKDKKSVVAKKNNTTDDDESESSSNDDDFNEYDSDYSPEDDPDRPWCICRKPHGNRYE